MSLITIKPFAKINEIPENSIMALDTSIVWGAWADPDIQKKPVEKNEFDTFFKATAARNISIGLPIKVHEELNILSTAVVLGDKDTRKRKLKEDRTLMNRPMDMVDRVLSEMSKLPNFYPDPIGSITPEILTNARQLVRDYGLELPDATIFETIKAEPEIKFFATKDGDYHNIGNNDTHTIYVPSWQYRTIIRERQNKAPID